MRKYRKPLPADYSDRHKSGRPSRYWDDAAKGGKEPTLLELLEALEGPGCPICFLAKRTVRRYLEAYCSESVTDVQARERIRSAQGFCTRHAHQFLDLQDSLAVAITYADVLSTLTRELERPSEGGKESAGLGRLLRRARRAGALTPGAPCPACEEQWVSEHRYAQALVVHMGGELAERLQGSRGLCLPHLRLAFAQADDGGRELLAEAHRRAWTELHGHLEEIVRKADYRFAEEGISPEEKRSLLDSINRVAGEREIR